jgi:putative heme-binding domain-containing protein
VLAAGKHPDSNVRILFEKYLPEDQRAKRLGDAIQADEILKITGDAKRGERIFRQSTAARCKSCHSVNGEGATLGPDLSAIGKKYDRAALLETILQPSKAISHEYVPHLVETSAGLTYLGLLVEKNAERVVLKDTQSKLIRIPASDLESIQEHRISLMPELVLKDITAQDAADLLAYMTTLQAATKPGEAQKSASP